MGPQASVSVSQHSLLLNDEKVLSHPSVDDISQDEEVM